MADLFSPEMRPEPFDAPISRDGKRAKMLARLKAGPLSTYDAERFSHRGQATIHSLQNEGHEIELIDLDGVPSYVYREHRPRVKVSKTMQELYYASPHWRATALARKELDNFRCQQCGASEELETHHWRYELFAESVQHDLITLCRVCHESIHRAISGSGVHFPAFVADDAAARIAGESFDERGPGG